MDYLITYWQPLSGLLIGILVLGLFFILHLRWKKPIIEWVVMKVFRDISYMQSTESFFNVVVSFLFTMGALMIILALMFLGF